MVAPRLTTSRATSRSTRSSSPRAAAQLLVRVPLEAIRDIDFPRTSRGYLDSRSLRRCCRTRRPVRIADSIEIYEGGRGCRTARRRDQISLESDRRSRPLTTRCAHVTGPKLPNERERRLEPGVLRRAVRVPDSIRPIRCFRSARSRTAGRARGHRAAVPAARRRGARL